MSPNPCRTAWGRGCLADDVGSRQGPLPGIPTLSDGKVRDDQRMLYHNEDEEMSKRICSFSFNFVRNLTVIIRCFSHVGKCAFTNQGF